MVVAKIENITITTDSSYFNFQLTGYIWLTANLKMWDEYKLLSMALMELYVMMTLITKLPLYSVECLAIRKFYRYIATSFCISVTKQTC